MGKLDEFKVKLPPGGVRGYLGEAGGSGRQSPNQERRQPTFEDVMQEYGSVTRNIGRCLFLFDATGSMQPHWDHLRGKLREILGRLLKAGGAPELKMIGYRDDCDGERIIEPSIWSRDPEELGKFLKRIHCDGGGDTPEAVDRALQAALEEQGALAGVVLIGDSPPHANRPGIKEAKELGRRQWPVYAIVIGGNADAMKSFEAISRASGGRVIELDRIEELYDVLGVVLAHAMGEEAFREYLSRYRGELTASGAAVVRLLGPGKR